MPVAKKDVATKKVFQPKTAATKSIAKRNGLKEDIPSERPGIYVWTRILKMQPGIKQNPVQIERVVIRSLTAEQPLEINRVLGATSVSARFSSVQTSDSMYVEKIALPNDLIPNAQFAIDCFVLPVQTTVQDARDWPNSPEGKKWTGDKRVVSLYLAYKTFKGVDKATLVSSSK
jgi:hypothetical protein